MSCCSTNNVKESKVNEPARREAAFQPRVDIHETGDEWVIHADVPGATKDALDLNFEDGILSVKAEVKPRRRQESNLLLREYPVGSFERRFRIGEGVDAGRISAALDSGVLTIHLPKAESIKPRKIEIQSN